MSQTTEQKKSRKALEAMGQKMITDIDHLPEDLRAEWEDSRDSIIEARRYAEIVDGTKMIY